MKPNTVNPNNFKVEKILYDDNLFSIAYGKWQDGDFHIAMRWNGDNNNPNDKGYPKVFGHPMWFLIPENLTFPILKMLLDTNDAIVGTVLVALEKEIMKNIQ